MKKIVKYLMYSSIIFTSFFIVNDLKGTHMVGGDLTYKYLGKDTFQLTLTLRRDCQLGSPEAQFDDPALISIYDGATGRLRIDLGYFGGLMIPFSKDDTLNTFVRSDCGFEGTQVCVHETKYVKKVYLPFSQTGYILVYQRCCRNSSLNNIVDPLDAGSTYYVKINGPTANVRNNSPVFKSWPDIYICADKEFVYDHSAIDSDGDSLVYKLWNPIYGLTMRSPKLSQPFIVKPEFIPVQYLPGFGVENFLGGVPLKIDSRTGIITAKPNAVGQFLVGIEVEEYRNGVLIGSTMRDFQYNVRVCSQPPKADFTGPMTSCNSLTIPFENKSLATERFEWNFNYPDSNIAFISTEVNPTFTFPKDGIYQVRLLAIRGSDNCRDEIIKTVSVFNLKYEANFSVTPVDCKFGDSLRIQLTDLSTIDRNEFFTINWKWIVQQENSTRVFTGPSPIFNVNTTENLTITLEVECSNGCTAEVTRQIDLLEVMLLANFEVTGIFCTDVDSITLSFNDVSTYYQSQDSISSRRWVITANGSTFERSEKTFSITLPRKDIHVKLIASGGPCIDSVSKSFPFNELFPMVSLNAEVGCEGADAKIKYWPSVGNGALFKVQSYYWLSGNERFDVDTLTLIRKFNDTVTVKLLAVLSNGCEIEVLKTINLMEFEKTADFTATPVGCPDDETVEYQVTYTGSSGFRDLLWTITENGFSVTSDLVSFKYKANKNNTFNINVVANYDGNCSRSKAQGITGSNFAEIDLVNSTIEVCPLEPKRLFNSSNPNLTYTWDPMVGLDLTDRLNPLVTTDISRTYKVTASDGLCSVTKEIRVNVLDSLQLDVEVMSASCDENFVLKAKGGKGEGRYEWSTLHDFSNIIGRDSVINFTITGGMQRLFVRFAGPFCNSLVKTVELSNELPEVKKPVNLVYCGGDLLTITVENSRPFQNLSFVWANSPFINSDLNRASVNIRTQRTDVSIISLPFKVTNQFGCSLEDTILISPTVRETADVNFNVTNCDSFIVCFTVAGSFNGDYEVNFGDGTILARNTNVSPQFCHNYNKEGIYQVKITSLKTNCGFDQVIKSVQLNKLHFDLTAKDTIVVCKDVDATLSLREGLPQLTVVWKNAQGVQVGTGNSITVKAVNSTKYMIEARDVNGCKFTDEVVLNVLDNLPMIALPADFRACQGDTAVLPVSLIDPSIETTVVWAADPRIISGGNSLQPVMGIGKNEAGPIVLKYTSTNSLGCVTKGEISIAVGQRPVARVDIKVDDCGALRVCFKAEGQDLRSLVWDFGDLTSGGDTSRNAEVCYTYPKEGLYQVSLRGLEAFCDFDPVIVPVQLNKITEIIEIDSASACLMDSVTLSAKTDNINLSYKWINQQGVLLSTAKSFKYAVQKNEKIFATATDDNGCEFRDSVNITGINEFPQLVFVSPLQVCLGDTVYFPMVNGNRNHIINILWDASPRIIGKRDTLNPLIGIPATVMSPFTIGFTASTQFGCTIRDSVRFIPEAPPVADFSYVVEDCDNFKVCFKITGDIKGFPYWNFGDTLTENDFSLEKEVCYTYPGPGTYKVELINKTNFCKFVPVTKFITLNQSLQFFERDTQEVCKGVISNIPVPARAQGLRFEWFDLRGNSLGTSNPLAIRVDSVRSIVLRALDANNCPFRDTLLLMPFTFDFELKVPQVFCLDKEIEAEIIIKNTGVNFTYQWLPLDCIKRGQGTSKVMIDVKAAKDVIVIVTHPAIGCTLRDTFNVEPKRVVVNVAASPDTVIRLLKSTDIFVSNPQPGWTYQWSNGNRNVRQTVSPSETTTYTVTVTDSEGCTGTASITIRVIQPVCEDDVFIPNAFTPNNDRVNDILYVRSNYIDEMELIIFNRWGQEVFKSVNQNDGWDGTFKGVTLAPDAFAYFLKVKCIDGTEIQRKGNVSILK